MRRITEEDKIKILVLIYICIAIAILIMVARTTSKTEYVPEPVAPQTVEIRIISETDTPVEIERKTYLGEFKVSAYCACSVCCGEWADGLTYTGTVATERQTIAVDPDVIPLGSIVEINGEKYIAEDIGGAIKDKRIDMYFSSHDEALQYGVQYHDVYLML